MSIIDAGQASDEAKVDSHYKSLKCEIQPLDRNSDDFKMVETYVAFKLYIF